jgi:GT2 family glycosyltransferase
MTKPGISVVIVSWNTKDITDRCLQCMKKAVDFVKKQADVEVIVVENASTDGTYDMIAKKHPWVKLFDSGSDLGYGKGNNYGFKRTNPKYEYLLLLNNDAYVREDTLAKSLLFFQREKDCDVMGCQLHYEDERFQPSAGNLPTPFSVWGWIWGLDLIPGLKGFFKPVHPKNPEFFKSDREVGWVMGAFLFMRRKVYEKTNGFDENFFMYMEEVEWCRRAGQAGFHIWYTPHFSIIHVDKASAFGLPEELIKIFYREIMGLMYLLKKCYPSQMWWIKISTQIGITIRLIAFTVLGNNMRRDAYLKILKNL